MRLERVDFRPKRGGGMDRQRANMRPRTNLKLKRANMRFEGAVLRLERAIQSLKGLISGLRGLIGV